MFNTKDLLSYAEIRPYTNQVEIHPYLQQHALVDFCKQQGIRITAFSPLGSPSYVQLNMDQGLGVGVLNEPVVLALASKYNKTPAQVVLRYHVKRLFKTFNLILATQLISLYVVIFLILRWNIERGNGVIPKSCKVSRVAENAAIFDFNLTEEEVRYPRLLYFSYITLMFLLD